MAPREGFLVFYTVYSWMGRDSTDTLEIILSDKLSSFSSCSVMSDSLGPHGLFYFAGVY